MYINVMKHVIEKGIRKKLADNSGQKRFVDAKRIMYETNRYKIYLHDIFHSFFFCITK